MASGAQLYMQSRRRIWKARAEGHVWSAIIVVSRPFAKDLFEVLLVQGDLPIKARPAQAADQSPAVGVGLGSADRRLREVTPKVSIAMDLRWDCHLAVVCPLCHNSTGSPEVNCPLNAPLLSL